MIRVRVVLEGSQQRQVACGHLGLSTARPGRSGHRSVHARRGADDLSSRHVRRLKIPPRLHQREISEKGEEAMRQLQARVTTADHNAEILKRVSESYLNNLKNAPRFAE